MTTSFLPCSADTPLHKTSYSYSSSLVMEACTRFLNTKDTEVFDSREHVEKMLVHAYNLLHHPFFPFFPHSSLLDFSLAEITSSPFSSFLSSFTYLSFLSLPFSFMPHTTPLDSSSLQYPYFFSPLPKCFLNKMISKCLHHPLHLSETCPLMSARGGLTCLLIRNNCPDFLQKKWSK